MDEQTQKEITQYLIKLPKSVRDLIVDKTWEVRVAEIGQKYSLTNEQLVLLKNEVLYLIIGLTPEEVFLDTIVVEIGISRILATEIMNELDTRIFQYIANATNGEVEIQYEQGMSNNSTNLELAPNDLPMVEEGQVARDVPEVVNAPVQNISTALAKDMVPTDVTVPTDDISVPRYIPPMNVPTSQSVQPPMPEGALLRSPVRDSQPQPKPQYQSPSLSGVRSEQQTETQLKSQPESAQKPGPNNLPGIEIISENTPEKKYIVDPYREPIN